MVASPGDSPERRLRAGKSPAGDWSTDVIFEPLRRAASPPSAARQEVRERRTERVRTAERVAPIERLRPVEPGVTAPPAETVDVERRAAADRLAPWLAAVTLASITMALHGYRLRFAPDLFSDEGNYLLVGRNLARGMGLVGDQGVFFWHPPLYMIAEAIYINAARLRDLDFFNLLFAVRWLNVIFSAATAGLLYLFGHRLRGTATALFMSGLFVIDPFVQRINRRSMLETLAMLLGLVGIALFFTYRERVSVWRQLASGVALGLAMLTKEVLFIEVLAVMVYALWARRSQLGDALRVAGIAVAVYSIYPAWALAIGEGDRYLAFKVFGLNRYLHAFGSKFALPVWYDIRLPVGGGPPFMESARYALGQYASTYLIMALGAGATLLLALRYRDRVAARYLVAWAAVSYAFVAGTVLAHLGDQFFYYLIVPALAVTGYAASVSFLPHHATTEVTPAVIVDEYDERVVPIRPGVAVGPQPSAPPRLVWLLPLLAVLVLYDGIQWARLYAFGTDNAYSHVYSYVRANVPKGSTIVVGTDLANYLLKPDYDIQYYRDQQNVESHNVRYFILSTKEPWGHYNAVTPEFYAWVMSQSRPLLEVPGNTFWKLGVYERQAAAQPQAPAASPAAPPTAPPAR